MHTNKVKEILSYPYTKALIRQEGGRYYAKIAEFPGCHASGSNQEEALHNLDEVAEDWIESELEQGHSIPMPEQNEKYSGKFLARVSPELHRDLAVNAERYGISLNQYVVQKLAARAAEDDLILTLLEKLKNSSVIKMIMTGSHETSPGTYVSASLGTSVETAPKMGN